MDPLVMKLLEAAPSQAAVIAVVVLFLRAQARESQRKERVFKELQNSQAQVFQGIHDEHLYQRQLTREAIQESSEALKRSATMLELLSKTVDKCHTQP